MFVLSGVQRERMRPLADAAVHRVDELAAMARVAERSASSSIAVTARTMSLELGGSRLRGGCLCQTCGPPAWTRGWSRPRCSTSATAA
jgi:hypothetical protein